MSINANIKVLWSVWDNNPVVSWEYLGKIYSVDMKVPPVAVAIFPIHQLVAIAGSFDVFGSENLQTFRWTGEHSKTFVAPPLGEKAHFGGARELDSGEIEAMVGFFASGSWQDTAGHLDLDSGELRNFHRSY